MVSKLVDHTVPDRGEPDRIRGVRTQMFGPYNVFHHRFQQDVVPHGRMSYKRRAMVDRASALAVAAPGGVETAP